MPSVVVVVVVVVVVAAALHMNTSRGTPAQRMCVVGG